MKRLVRISSLGTQGDGVAELPGGIVHLPQTLPGELVEIEDETGKPVVSQIREPSSDRIIPACPHFGICGGCTLQHFELGEYLCWKREVVVTALRRSGIDCQVAPIQSCEPQSRRRVVFSARNTAAGPVLGFNKAGSHEIVPIVECPVLVPAIIDALDRLRSLLALFGKTGKPLRMTVTETESGLDVGISDADRISDNLRRALTTFAVAHRFARISIDGEVIIEPAKPVIRFGDVAITPPPGGFLQATARAETLISELVISHLRKSKRVADLFAGSGTFALRLAKNSIVHAVENDAVALQALDDGFRFAPGLKTVTHERRDLFRRPLTVNELKDYDGLVFDPPRAGARDQAFAIAKSDIRRVVAVSCNPATLARDLVILTGGGFRVVSVTPIDQFLWSPHVEVVALLEKPKRRR
ncbi:MAG: class I SAM-dependent RNA methyltransferase [Rhizobiaceae bacterium]